MTVAACGCPLRVQNPAVGAAAGSARSGAATMSAHARGEVATAPAGYARGTRSPEPREERKALWRLLYETAARASEILSLNIEDIDRDKSGGWTLHQLRHSAITHLAEDNVALPMLMAKSRHTSLRSLQKYARPGADAVAALTAAHDPERRRR